MQIQEHYLALVEKILNEGTVCHNRTGIDTKAISGAMIEHDMSDGFPLFTFRKTPFKSTAIELEFFIKGLTDKRWLEDRGCKYWSNWCSREKVPYATDEKTKEKMSRERDLGPLGYSFEWRNFGGDYRSYDDFDHNGSDQLKNLVDTLKKDPESRRMIVSGWNPNSMDRSALNCCHVMFNVRILGDKLDLCYYQRSVDVCCNQTIVTYALLLHLLTLEANKYRKENNLPLLKEGKLIGFWFNCHIYENHFENTRLMLERPIHKLPTIQTQNFKSIFDWQYNDTKLIDYSPEPSIKFEVAV
jgi:thymidylate synthase